MSTMARADLAASLKLLWGDSASYWSLAADADYVRHLDDALPGFGNAWPHRVGASATVTAGVADYPLPADFVGLLSLEWGRDQRARARQWNTDWPGRAPTAQVLYTAADGWVLRLTPVPTAADVALLGTACPYVYRAQHVIGDLAAETTVPATLRQSLLMYGLAAGLQELAARNVLKPIQLHRGMGSVPANSTPQAALDAVRRSLGVAA